MKAFLSTHVNKVDRKGRVSVPAPFRATLALTGAAGLIVHPSVLTKALEVNERDFFDRLNRHRETRSLEAGEFEKLLTGGGDPAIDLMMASAHDLPIDGEGRVVLPRDLADHAGIEDRAAFVGCGNRFEIWSPDAFADHRRAVLADMRDRLAAAGRPGAEGAA